jgi:hypothetical protein
MLNYSTSVGMAVKAKSSELLILKLRLFPSVSSYSSSARSLTPSDALCTLSSHSHINLPPHSHLLPLLSSLFAFPSSTSSRPPLPPSNALRTPPKTTGRDGATLWDSAELSSLPLRLRGEADDPFSSPTSLVFASFLLLSRFQSLSQLNMPPLAVNDYLTSNPSLRSPLYYATWGLFYLSYALSPGLITVLQVLVLALTVGLPPLERATARVRIRLAGSEWASERFRDEFTGPRPPAEWPGWMAATGKALDVRWMGSGAWAGVSGAIKWLGSLVGMGALFVLLFLLSLFSLSVVFQ